MNIPQRSTKELSDDRFTFTAKPSFMKAFRDFAAKTGEDMSSIIRDAVTAKMDGKTVASQALVDAGLNNFRAKFLTRAPAGPWQESIEHAGDFVLSEPIADYLDARDGDVVVGVLGESMDGRGIPDGALLLMRPVSPHRQPARSEIALVQAHDGNGNYTSTIKEWRGMEGQVPRLVDGEGNAFEWPEDTVDYQAVAVAKGLIARL